MASLRVKTTSVDPSSVLVNRPSAVDNALVLFPIFDDDDKCDNYII